MYAVEASAMADYCIMLKDANPGMLSPQPSGASRLHPAVQSWGLQRMGLARSMQVSNLVL